MKEREIKGFYDFAGFRLDADERVLWRGGEAVSLTPKELELLLALVERAPGVVGKDELLERVWKDTYVEEGTLTRNVSWLRKKLEAAHGNGSKFIETVPKRGYRFLPPVTPIKKTPALVVEEQTVRHIRIEETVSIDNAPEAVEKPAALAPGAINLAKIDSGAFAAENFNNGFSAVSEAPPPQLSPAPSARRVNRLWLALFGIVLLAAVGLGIYQFYFRRVEPRVLMASKIAPFSGLPGRENTPAFSPDGKQLAFTWNGGDGDDLDIYIRLVAEGEPVRLTDTEFNEVYPTFSPDGSRVAFVRALKTHGEIVLIPSLGGTERRVARLFSGNFSISFSPDGKRIAAIDTADSTDKKPYAVYLFDLETGERRRLTVPAEFQGETTPRFSPDGKQLAFVRVFNDREQDLFIAPTTGDAEPRQITFDRKIIHSLAWSADGAAIYFVTYRGSNRASLWRVPAAGGEPESVLTGGREITNLAASPDARTIAFVENAPQNLDVWNFGENTPTAKRLLASTHNELNPVLSPDGSRLVFTSNRTGKNELWMTDAAGKNLRQLTETDFSVGAPTFSPDGTLVTFDATANGTSDIFAVSAEGGGARRLTAPDETNDFRPIWSADGEFIYFSSTRAGETNIWRMPAAGGNAVQITKNGAIRTVAAPDGATVFFIKSERARDLWRIGANGEAERTVPEFTAAGFAGIWTTARSGIYFLAPDSGDFYKIKFYDFASGKIRDLPGNRKIPAQTYSDAISASADGKIFLYARANQNESSIMLAELAEN